MPIGTVSQAIASQAEHLRDTLEELVLLQGVLWKRINKATDVTAVSNRPARIPFNVLTGGAFRTGANLFDNAPLGRGTAPTQTFGTLSAVSFLQASEYSALAEYSTDSTQKAIENYVTLTNRQATETFAGYMDSLVCQSDGSDTLDTVTGTSGVNGILVSNANIFQDNQVVDVYSAGFGVLRGSFTIQSIDIANNTIWGTGAFPVGTIATDLLLVNGAAGAANSGFFGIPYYYVAGNAGNFMGIPRASFPGKFSTPNVAPVALTPAAVRAAQAQMDLAMGTDASDDEVVMHMNVDMAAAWENNALTVQSIIRNQESGDQTADMLHKRQTTTMAGREILRNVRARPGRIDAINFKHLFKLETKSLDMYEVGGQTIFPTYAADGGVNSTMIFYLTLMAQLGVGQPRRCFYMGPGIAIPNGYFGN
jgi:hypothetical protein